MKKTILIFFSLIYIATASNIDSLNIGGNTIKIPVPAGLEEISQVKVFKPLVTRIGGTQNKVLGVYYPTEHVESFPDVKTGLPHMWATILVHNKNVDYYATLKNYQDTVAYMKSNHDYIYKEVEKRLDGETSLFNTGLKKDYGFDFNLTLNVPRVIPNKFIEEDSYYGYMSLIKMDEKTTAVACVALLHIQQRIISMNIYKKYHSIDDIDSLMKESKMWLDDIVKLNPKDSTNTCDKGNILDCYSLGIITSNGSNGVKQDHTKAIEFFTKACDGGYANGCHELGKAYLAGRGVHKDDVKAIDLFNKACNGGYANACYNLGAAYGTGTVGVKLDYIKAINYYNKACDAGDGQSCSNIGVFYANGLGVKQNYLKAVEYYTKACDREYLSGCNNLGNMYSTGRGVKKDYSKALEIHKKACDAGGATSCFNLGSMYYLGQGVKTDMSKVKELMLKSCEGGYNQACINYRTLK